MIEIPVHDHTGKQVDSLRVDEQQLGGEVRPALLKQAYVRYHANRRQGSAATRGRSASEGSTRKLYRQKGTGYARAGTNSSPIWVRGGKAFGPRPREYTTTIPKKMRRRALRSALSSRARDEKIMVVDTLAVEQPKTKVVAGLLKSLSAPGARTLLVVGSDAGNIYLSGCNIKNLEVKPLAEIHTYDVLNNENIILNQLLYQFHMYPVLLHPRIRTTHDAGHPANSAVYNIIIQWGV